MMRDGYDPDEGGRYHGDDAHSHSSRFNRPEWWAIVLEQEAARSAVNDEEWRRLNAWYRAPQPGETFCPKCSGGVMKDPGALVPCIRCDGRSAL